MPFRLGGKDSGNLRISGFVSMTPWWILLRGLVGFSNLKSQFHHSPVLAEIKKAKILHIVLNSNAAFLSWEDWSRLFFSQHGVSCLGAQTDCAHRAPVCPSCTRVWDCIGSDSQDSSFLEVIFCFDSCLLCLTSCILFPHCICVFIKISPPPTEAGMWIWGVLCAPKLGCHSTVWCVQKTTGEYFPLQWKAVLTMLKGAFSGALGCILINHLTTTWILLTLHWFQ